MSLPVRWESAPLLYAGYYLPDILEAVPTVMPSSIIPPSHHELAELAAMARAFNAAPYSVVPKQRTSLRRIRRRLSPDDRQRLVERYTAGESTPTLSREFGISASSVCTLLRSQGVALRGQRLDMPTADRVVTLYREGRSLRQVANTVGCSYGTVRKVLHEAAVPMRM